MNETYGPHGDDSHCFGFNQIIIRKDLSAFCETWGSWVTRVATNRSKMNSRTSELHEEGKARPVLMLALKRESSEFPKRASIFHLAFTALHCVMGVQERRKERKKCLKLYFCGIEGFDIWA